MSTRRLPPLYPLRAFEAAARLSSFTLAAQELSVSQSAVSHQIRTLENYFGVPLFYRSRSALRLTAEGMRVFAACETAFNLLAQVNDLLPQADLQATLTLCTPPLFFNGWLLPRLRQFSRQYPRIGFRFVNYTRGLRLSPADVDIAVVWGERVWDGFVGERMLEMSYSPVASPALAATLPAEFSPAVLETNMLLHLYDHRGWAAWLAEAGFSGVPATGGWVFQEPGMMIEAAASGQGIALGAFPVLDDAVRTGRLVPVFGHPVNPNTYFLAMSQRSVDKPAVRAFWNWFTHQDLPPAG